MLCAHEKIFTFTSPGNIASGHDGFIMDCTNLNGELFSVTSKRGIPECFASSCDLSKWDTVKEQMFDEGMKELLRSYSARGMTCSYRSLSSADSEGDSTVAADTGSSSSSSVAHPHGVLVIPKESLSPQSPSHGSDEDYSSGSMGTGKVSAIAIVVATSAAATLLLF